MCQICLKSYKKESTLKNHSKTHEDTFYTALIVFNYISKAKNNIISSGLYKGDIQDEIENFEPDEVAVENICKYLNSVKMKDVESLYHRLFRDVMMNSSKYFTNISNRSAVVLSTKFAEIVISSKNTHEIAEEIAIKNLNEKELAGMQYLGGYVLRKIFCKIREMKKSEKTSKR